MATGINNDKGANDNPMHMPSDGDVYEVALAFGTVAGKQYDVGDTLTLVRKTAIAPFGYRSRISNWVVRCKYHKPPALETIWSSIWALIESGAIQLQRTSE